MISPLPTFQPWALPPAVPFTWKGRTIDTIVHSGDYNLVGDNETNDRVGLQNWLNACNSVTKMGWLDPPAVAYKMTEPTAYLTVPSNCFIRGAGIGSILRRHDGLAGGSWPLLWASGKSDILIERMNIQSDSVASTATDEGMQFDNCTTVELDRVWFDNLGYAVVTSSATTHGLSVLNSITGNVHNPFLLKYCHDAVFRNCILEATRTNKPSAPPHHFYIDYECDNVLVDLCTLTGGQDYCIQIYPGSNLTNIIFTDLTMTDVYLGPVIAGDTVAHGETIHDVRFSGVSGASTRYYNPSGGRQWFYLANGVYNALIEDFDIQGDDTNYLCRVSGIGANVVLQNGTMTHCLDDKLPSGIVVDSGSSPTTSNVTVS